MRIIQFLIAAFFITYCSFLSGCAPVNSGTSGTLTPPTTQQAVQSAVLAHSLEQTALNYFKNRVIPKIKDRVALAAATGAASQAQVLLDQYQKDIDSQNLAALQPDQTNIESAVAQIAIQAGLDALNAVNAPAGPSSMVHSQRELAAVLWVSAYWI